MAARAGILLEINSALGPGGLASLQAGVQMIGALGSKVKESIKELDKFSTALKNLEMDLGPIEKKTKGMIDTMAEIAGANKLAAAGVEITAEQFGILGAAATELAKATGQDATGAFNRLIKSVSKGETRALKELGIDLENTEDLVLAQAEAVEKLTAKYKDLDPEIETISEGLFALTNNLDTAAGSMWTIVQNTEGPFASAIAAINTGVGDFATNAMAAAQHGDTLSGAFLNATTSAEELKEEFYDLNKSMRNQIRETAELVGMSTSDYFRKYLFAPEELRGIMRQRRQEIALSTLEEDLARMGETVPGVEGLEGPGVTWHQPGKATGETKIPTREAGRGRGAGAPREKKYTGFVAPGEISITEQTQMRIYDVQQIEQKHSDFMAEENKRRFKENARMLKERHVQEAKAARMREETERIHRQKMWQFNQLFFGSLSSLMAVEHEKMFEIGKAAATVNTIISTAKGAMDAYSAMASIPIVGPALGAVAAAAVITAGAVQVATIQQQEFKGGAGAKATGMTGIGAVSTGPAAGGGYPYGAGAGDGQRQVVVNIRLEGGTDKIFEAVEEENDRRNQSGIRSFEMAS